MTAEHLRWEELAVGHALAALEPEDEQEFLAHLAGCAECARVLDETAGLAGLLAYAAEPTPPSPDLLPRILADIRTSDRPPVAFGGGPRLPVRPPAPRPVPSRPGGSVRVSGTRAGDRHPPQRHRPILSRPRIVRTADRVRWVAVAAAFALVLSLGGWNVVLHNRQGAIEEIAARRAQAVELLNDPTSQRVSLASADGSSRLATAVIKGREVWLVLAGLQPNDVDSTVYVLWERPRTGVTTAIGTFDVPTGDVSAVRVGTLRGDLSTVDALAVTREAGREAPVSGSDAVATGRVLSA